MHCIPTVWQDQAKVEAFLSGVPNDSMIILDLACDLQPKWETTQSFYGKPFIWCLLHNLGGARGIYGNLTGIANQPVDARNAPGSSMVGIGMTPEAIEHNPVVYDLMVSTLCVIQVTQRFEQLQLIFETGCTRAHIPRAL